MSTKFYIKDNNGIYLSTDGKIRYTLLEGKELYDFLKTENGRSRCFHVDIDENGNKIGIEAEPKMITACAAQRERDRYRHKVMTKLNITVVSANALVSVPGEDDLELIDTVADEDVDLEAEAMHDLDLEILKKALQALTKEEYRIKQPLLHLENRITKGCRGINSPDRKRKAVGQKRHDSTQVDERHILRRVEKGTAYFDWP